MAIYAITPMHSEYTHDSWVLREQEYIYCVNSIIIPYDPNPADITNLNAAIDQVYTIARVEYGRYKRLHEEYSVKKKNSETEVYMIVKSQLTDADGKKTEAELKAMGIAYLNKKEIIPGFNIYQMVDTATNRMIFMESVIDVLNRKADKLITDSGAMKLAGKLT